MVDLSILVCSVHTRYKTFLPKLQDQLYSQLAALSEADQSRVEIIVLTDNKQIVLGHKRNTMINIAQGNYVVFVDDDDRIAGDYVAQLLKATAKGTDSIVFKAEVSLNGETPIVCDYSKDHRRDYNHRSGFFRVPNHICCVRRDLALKCKFPEVLYGEDAGYSKELLPHLKTEHKINKILYYYDYNATTTETQSWMAEQKPGTALIDLIILSKAEDAKGRAMTQKAIDSALQGSNGLPIHVIVIEGGIAQYRNAATIPNTGKFNYNEFANQGAALGQAKWIMIANSDLIFQEGWLHELIKPDHPIVSPHEPNDSRQADITADTTGDVCGKHFSGWCFMISRDLWRKIGKFDTDVDFWCSDDVVIEQVKAAGVMPMVVKKSIVNHEGSQTLRQQPEDDQTDLKWRNVYIFNKKYNKNKFASHPAYMIWLKNNEQLIKKGRV